MIRFQNLDKKPISIGYFRPEMVRLLNLIAVWSARRGKVVRVTSLNDRRHSSKSLHYEDLAVDFVVDGANPVVDTSSLVGFLRKNLGEGYDIVWLEPGHMTHAHVEWDARQR